MSCTRTRQLLDAWVDGELDRATSGEIATHLAQCVACDTLRAEREALRQALRRAAPREPVPGAVAASIQRAIERENAAIDQRPGSPSWLQAFLLAGASACAAAALAIVVLRPPPSESIREAIVASHVAALAQAHGDAAQLVQVVASDRHVVKPWFQGKVDVAPPVRDLKSEGFTLIGGRTDRIASQQAAVLVYKIRNHPIELYVWSDDSATQTTSQSSWRGFGVARWSAGGLAFAAVSDVDSKDLQRFAEVVQAAQ